MGSTSGEDDAATVALLLESAPSRPGATLAVGRDATRCHLVTPADWLFVSRVHLEFQCDEDRTWWVTWRRGSQNAPVAEVQVGDGDARELPYGGTTSLTQLGSGDVVILDLNGERRVTIGWFHTAD